MRYLKKEAPIEIPLLTICKKVVKIQGSKVIDLETGKEVYVEYLYPIYYPYVTNWEEPIIKKNIENLLLHHCETTLNRIENDIKCYLGMDDILKAISRVQDTSSEKLRADRVLEWYRQAKDYYDKEDMITCLGDLEQLNHLREILKEETDTNLVKVVNEILESYNEED